MNKRDQMRAAREQNRAQSGPPPTLLQEGDAAFFGQLANIGDVRMTRLADGSVQFGNFVLTRVGLRFLADDISLEEWQDFGQWLKDFKQTYQMLMLDWLVLGQRVWGDTYRAYAEELGFKVDTLYTYVWVLSRVEISIRIENLTLKHYRLVAPYEHEEQKRWLELASKGTDGKRWSTRRLKAEMEAHYEQKLDDGSPPPPPSHPLLDKINKRRFNKIWRKMEQNQDISLDDVVLLRNWLAEVERAAREKKAASTE